MKIAFAIEHFCPAQGGAERYAWGLAQWLVQRGHEVHVYTLTGPAEPLEGICIHILDLSGPGRGRQYSFALALEEALSGTRYDLVQGFNHARPCDVLRLGGGVNRAFEYFNALSGRSRFVVRAKLWSHHILPRYRRLRANEEEQFADPYRHFIAVSNRVADDMHHYYPACRDRVHVIPNGLDLDSFNVAGARAQREEMREALGIGPDEYMLLFASNNYRLKGLHDIISALPLVRRRCDRPLTLVVTGRDESRSFERRATRLSVRSLIMFCGSRDDLVGFYGAADTLLHPTYYDACANVCLEAAACGLPVLTSSNNGAAEQLASSAGCVTIEMPTTRRGLADAICRTLELVGRDDVREAQQACARAIPIEKNYEAVMALYETVVSERRRRAGDSA